MVKRAGCSVGPGWPALGRNKQAQENLIGPAFAGTVHMHTMPTRPKVKICCIKSPEEAELAIAYGASAIGLVSAMPSGPGVISEEAIMHIAGTVPPPIATVLLTSELRAEVIIAQQRRCRTNTIQLCDYVPSDVYQQLRHALPGIALVQVIHVTGPESVDLAVAAATHVDAILLDSGNPALATKELGGTGRTHDWALSRRIREVIRKPLFLAGGLNPSNVAMAITAVRPFGIDVCRGVRTNDKLDAAKLAAFFDALPK